MLEEQSQFDPIARKFEWVAKDLLRDADMYELADGIDDLAAIMEAVIRGAERHYVARFISAEKGGMRLFIDTRFDGEDEELGADESLDEDSELVRDLIVETGTIEMTLANDDGETIVSITQEDDFEADIGGHVHLLEFTPDFHAESPNYHLSEATRLLKEIVVVDSRGDGEIIQNPVQVGLLFEHAKQFLATTDERTLWQVDQLPHDEEIENPANMFVNAERMQPLSRRARSLGDSTVSQLRFLDFNTETGYLLEFIEDHLVSLRQGVIEANDFSPVSELVTQETELDALPIDEDALFALLQRLGLHYKSQFVD